MKWARFSGPFLEVVLNSSVKIAWNADLRQRKAF